MKECIMSKLHIQKMDKFIEPYIKFINNNYDNNDHEFFIINSSDYNGKIKYENTNYVLSKPFDYLKLIKRMNKSREIFIHSLLIPNILIILLLQPWLLKKCYWIVWGSDLYVYRRPRRSIKAKIKEIVRATLIKKFGSIITLVEEDYELANKWYHVEGKYYHGAYVNPVSKEYLDSLPISRKGNSDPTVIQIGNSADPTNNHLDAIRKLKHLKEKNILIYAPLSYAGNKTYIESVMNEGKKHFGNKFIPLTEFLQPKEYSIYLNNIDIAIFNNDRQQALGNIYALLYLNKKVYIRSDTTMWSHFKKEFDINMNDFLKISNTSFEDFISNEVKNSGKINKVFNEDYLKNIWNPIFKEE